MLTHDQKYFYKYITANTLLAILKNLKIRYSAPSLFNDPFDNQFNLTKEFSDEEIIIKTYRSILQTDPRVNVLVKEERERTVQNFDDIDKKELVKTIRGYKNLLDNYIEMMMTNNKILCLTENKDNLLMWAHYADRHQGAVIKFKCLPEKDTPFCIAQKVEYKEELPSLKLEEFIKNFNSKAIGEKIWKDVVSTKSIDWKYENEWRIILPTNDPNSDYYEMALFEEELDSIYLGCKMSPENKYKVLSSSMNNPHIKVFDSDKDPNLFKLNFKQIR